jgi:hypothetical protein
MCVKRIGVFALAALALGAVLWAAFGPGLPGGPNRAEAQQGGRVKAGKYEYLSALHTVVMIDTESGKTWALASPMLGGFGGMGIGGGFGGMGLGGGGEFAWVPITKFDDVEGYRKWVKEQQEAMFRGRPGFPGFPGDGFRDRKIEEKPRAIDKGKFEEKKDKFEDRPKLERKLQGQRPGADRLTARIVMSALLLSESPPSYLSVYRLANVSALASWSARPRR